MKPKYNKTLRRSIKCYYCNEKGHKWVTCHYINCNSGSNCIIEGEWNLAGNYCTTCGKRKNFLFKIAFVSKI
ncbi:19297_t:CDS:2 [Dentiscutata erythropus]|uniref:19297_t:CDS:1 n=1 Tax=Dentiscutata erythropus TaxID=1348616 RepID=A0A9N8VEJ7_9GLOM|nr:19297_t:CDS:2 [Dentiscutata erythropus]